MGVCFEGIAFLSQAGRAFNIYRAHGCAPV